METVSAIVILSVAVPPMLWAVTQAQRQRMNPVLASKARWLAVEKLEDIVADRHAPPRGSAFRSRPEEVDRHAVERTQVHPVGRDCVDELQRLGGVPTEQVLDQSDRMLLSTDSQQLLHLFQAHVSPE